MRISFRFGASRVRGIGAQLDSTNRFRMGSLCLLVFSSGKDVGGHCCCSKSTLARAGNGRRGPAGNAVAKVGAADKGDCVCNVTGITSGRLSEGNRLGDGLSEVDSIDSLGRLAAVLGGSNGVTHSSTSLLVDNGFRTADTDTSSGRRNVYGVPAAGGTLDKALLLHHSSSRVAFGVGLKRGVRDFRFGD